MHMIHRLIIYFIFIVIIFLSENLKEMQNSFLKITFVKKICILKTNMMVHQINARLV